MIKLPIGVNIHRCWYNGPIENCDRQSRKECVGCIFKPKNSSGANIKLGDVIGLDKAKEALNRRMVEVLKHKKKLV